jgi:hypothetical protein
MRCATWEPISLGSPECLRNKHTTKKEREKEKDALPSFSIQARNLTPVLASLVFKFSLYKQAHAIAKTNLNEFETRVLPRVTRDNTTFNREYSYVEYELDNLIRDGEDAHPGKPSGRETEKYMAQGVIMRSLV